MFKKPVASELVFDTLRAPLNGMGA